MRTLPIPMPLDADQLAAAVSRHLQVDARVAELQRVTGGASRETWTFELQSPTGSERLVLRRDPGAAVGQSERATEFELLRAARAAGVDAPRARFMLDETDQLGSGFVMDHVAGETIARKILRDEKFEAARGVLTEQCASAAARIHAVDTATLPVLPALDAESQVEQWAAYLHALADPHPAFELAVQWLRAAVPPVSGPPRLVHGDFRLGNFVVSEHGLAAVLDWELAHLGDPLEDLGWLCVKSWRFGVNHRVVGGFGSVSELLDGYSSVATERPDEETVRWWCALGTLKWGLMCRLQTEAHLSGAVRSVELATLGRRIAEMEWDVLALVEGSW